MTLAAVDTLYTVAIGDSLSKLAARFYGDPGKYPAIAAKNNVNPNAILMVGQRLIIPAISPVEEVTVTNASRVPDPIAAPSSGLPVVQGIETITTTASVWYKDWRYWAAIGGVAAVLWYFSSSRRR